MQMPGKRLFGTLIFICFLAPTDPHSRLHTRFSKIPGSAPDRGLHVYIHIRFTKDGYLCDWALTRGTEHFAFPPVLRDWVYKSLVYATGYIKDPVPLIEKTRGLSPGGRFPPSFIHQVIITGLISNRMFSP